jgi:hypothetical protein
MADICGPFTLEDLDQFGTLDSLPFSLNSSVWTSTTTCIMFFASDISNTATVSALGGMNVEASGSIEANATLSAEASRTRNGVIDIAAMGAMSIEGYIYGEEWSDVSEESNTWSIVSANSNTWTNVPAGTNTWLRQN